MFYLIYDKGLSRAGWDNTKGFLINVYIKVVMHWLLCNVPVVNVTIIILWDTAMKDVFQNLPGSKINSGSKFISHEMAEVHVRASKTSWTMKLVKRSLVET